jgi:hypothetical protein
MDHHLLIIIKVEYFKITFQFPIYLTSYEIGRRYVIHGSLTTGNGGLL